MAEQRHYDEARKIVRGFTSRVGMDGEHEEELERLFAEALALAEQRGRDQCRRCEGTGRWRHEPTEDEAIMCPDCTGSGKAKPLPILSEQRGAGSGECPECKRRNSPGFKDVAARCAG